MNNILSGQITSPLFEARDFKAKKAYEGIDWKSAKDRRTDSNHIFIEFAPRR